jgi:ABC-type Fe3+/spermidine/putrescine transport system ATPase subunit
MNVRALDKVSIKIKDKWIFRNCSLEINQGEIFGVLGVSGSGKSILLEIILGKQKKFTGEVKNNFKQTFFYAKENVTGLKSFFNSSKNEVSDGEKQKLEIENLLNQATSESLLILDNPFSDLDEIWKNKLFAKMRQIVGEKQLTVLITTHLHEDAFVLCDRIGVLDKGDFAQIGTPKELYEMPYNFAVASILGRNNFIEARRVTFSNQKIPEFQTIIGEHRLHTGKSDKFSLGAITKNITLAIRPEFVSISFGASFPEDNLIKAKVVKIQYLGATTRVFLDANGLLLEALVLRLVGLNIGEECMVGIPPDRLLILKD